MAKGNNNGKSRKPHNYKPYDAANSSYIFRLTSKVSEILPQSQWLSRWLSPAPQVDVRNDSEEEDDEEEHQQPAKKRLCLNATNEFTRNHIGSRLTGNSSTDAGDISPIPGPSGLHLNRKSNFILSTPAATQTQSTSNLAGKVNSGDDSSDGSESTSGCSSLVPQGEKDKMTTAKSTYVSVVPSKRPPIHSTPKFLPPPPPTSSPSRTMNISRRSSFSSTSTSESTNRPAKCPKVDSSSPQKSRPSFDSFVFNNPLRRSLCLNTSATSNLDDSTSSPFYKGRTMYGGASSCREALTTPLLSPRLSSPKVISVRPTTTPEVSKDRIGSSAMRILKALEQFSTPVQETKKTPLKNEKERRKRKHLQPYEELIIPQMPDLLRIKRKERPRSPSRPQTSNMDQNKPQPYSLRVDDGGEKSDFIGSIKRKQNEDLESERVQPVNLPDVKLPITTLPKFTMPSLPKNPAVSSAVKEQVAIPSDPTTSTLKALPTSVPQIKPTKSSEFSFSKPIVESSKGLSVNSVKVQFKFSEALDGKKLQNKSDLFKSDATNLDKKISSNENVKPSPIESSELKMISTSSTFKLKEKVHKNAEGKENCSIIITPPTQYTAGTVMDFLKKNNGFGDSFALPKGNWVCDTCLVNNNSDKVKCAACETPKPNKDTKETTSTKSSSNDKKWDCKSCKLANSETDVKCKCCGADKSGKVATNAPLAKGLQDYIKLTADTWECKECFVRNKSNEKTCVSCSSPKPGGESKPPNTTAETKAPATTAPSLNSMFTKNTWECDTCLVQNKKDADACIACTTPRPGSAAKPAASKPTFSFGFAAAASATSETPSTGGFSFGIPTDDKKDTNAQTSSKPGGFSFGVPPESKTETKEKDLKFGFSSSPGNKSETLSFGSNTPQIPPKSLKDETATTSKSTSSPSMTMFNMPKTSTDQSKNDQPPAGEQKEEPKPKKRVSFGEPLVEEKTISSDSDSSVKANAATFSFGNSSDAAKSETMKFGFGSKNPNFTVSSTSSSNSIAETQSVSNSVFSFKGNSAVSSTTESSNAGSSTMASNAEPSNPLFNFGSSKLSASKESPTFGSGDKKEAPSVVFGSHNLDNKSSLFSGPLMTSEAKPATFGFGSTATKNNFAPSGDSLNKDGNAPFGSGKPMFNMPKMENKDAHVGNAVFGAGKSFFGSSENSLSKDSSQNLFALKPVTNATSQPQQEKESNLLFGSKLPAMKGFMGSDQKDENKSARLGGFINESNYFNSTNDKTVFGKKTDDWSQKMQAPSNAFETKASTSNSIVGFGTSNNLENKPAASPFAFNSTPNQISSTPFGFNKEPEAKPMTGGFTFSAGSNQQQPVQNAFNFPTEPKLGNQTQPSALFGSTNATPLFNAPNPTQTPLAFGASHSEPPQNQLFGFSAPPQVLNANVATPFAFGQNCIPNQPVAPNQPQPPTFDPNIKPNFKFTSGGAAPSFSAAPSQAPPPDEKRKIRKAFRRTR